MNWEFSYSNWEKNILFGIGNTTEYRSSKRAKKNPGVLKRCFIKGLHCASFIITDKVYDFRAMLGNPPVPPYGRDLHDDATEVENYEVNNKTGILVKLETF